MHLLMGFGLFNDKRLRVAISKDSTMVSIFHYRAEVTHCLNFP